MLRNGLNYLLRPKRVTFGKDLYISKPIERAWLSIASKVASYQLFVNNFYFIDTEVLPSARPADVYDVAGLLSPEKT